jgi:hypothetical protein
MSLVSAKIKNREASSNTSSRSERWTYAVVMDSADDTAIDAQLAVDVPLFTVHPVDSGMVCTRVDAKFIQDSAYAFEVVVEFSTIAPTQGAATDPLSQSIQISGGGLESTLPFGRDKAGKAVKNSAGDSFDSLPTYVQYDEQINVTLNQASISPDLFNTYRGAVNSDDFTLVYPDGMERDFDAGVCKMGDITYSYKFSNGVNYWEVTYPILIRVVTDEDISVATLNGTPVRPWKRKIVDEGYYEWAESERVRCVDSDGKPCVTPQKLDGTGVALTDQEAEPVALLFEDYVELPFGTLDLT